MVVGADYFLFACTLLLIIGFLLGIIYSYNRFFKIIFTLARMRVTIDDVSVRYGGVTIQHTGDQWSIWEAIKEAVKTFEAMK